ncbi:MAG TPA: CHASE3 domain-containing protein, partial [Archangium sp.]|uniref:methyl-accepting chemotaxis protein n=1 Tax=Archangium sp. TaxID=1872627 RepID=UPI002E333DF1
MLQNLTISRKLQLGFGVLVALLAATLWGAYGFFLLLVNNQDYFRSRDVQISMLSTGLQLVQMEQRVAEFALTGNESLLDALPEWRASVVENNLQLRKLTASNPRAQQLLEQLMVQYQQHYLPHLEHQVKLRRDMVAGRVPMEHVVDYVESGKGRQSLELMQSTAMAVIRDEQELNQRNAEVTDVQVSSVKRMLVGGGIVGPLLAVLLAWVLARSITRPLNEAVGLTVRLASGDLTTAVEVKGRDETAQMMAGMREMVQRFGGVLGEVRGAVGSLSGASGQVAAAAQALSQGTSTQAASVEETTTSLEQLSSSISQNAETSKQLERMAVRGAAEAEESGLAVNETVEAMAAIAERISIVEEIAYQTNLLALNA